jgi:hypothetical protein
MFSSRREKVESLCAIIKIWQGSIHTAHVTDCAVQHDIIVISRQSPCQISFVIKWDKFNVSLPGTFCLVCNLLSVILGLGQRRGAHVLVFLIAPTANM